MKNFLKTIRFSLVIFLITTASVVAQVNPESDPGSTTSDDTEPLPINNYIGVLVLVGIAIGACKINRVLSINKQT